MKKQRLRSLLILTSLVLSVVMISCDKEEEYFSIGAKFTYNVNTGWVVCPIGGHIMMNNFKLEETVPETGVKIKKIDFFLGNKLIKSCKEPPYELDYEVPEMPIGTYVMQMDVSLTAKGYVDTKIMDKHDIIIIERVENENNEE